MPEPDQPRFTDELADKVRAFCTEAREIDAIAAHLKMQDVAELTDWLESLAFAGKLQRLKGKKYIATRGATLVGTYRRGKGRGRNIGGYVNPTLDGLPNVDVPQGFDEGAQDGDLVLVSYKQNHRVGDRRSAHPGREYLGKVLSIIDARPTEAVGVFEIAPSGHFRVRLEGYNLPRHAWLQPEQAGRTKPGTVVRVRLRRKPDSSGRTLADLLGSVGRIDDPTHDLDNLVALFDFPGDFSEEAKAQAAALPADPDEKDFAGRIDLRKLPVITIDPKDAEDHDDAISIEELPEGMLRLGVHIADVAHYVTPGSALDVDARFRATSVYLPGRLIPMLPKQLSQGLCSLHDSVDRLAQSVFMWFDAAGVMQRREIVKSIVRVRRFLTYEEVLPVLQGKADTGDAVVDKLLVLGRKLADHLQARRIKRGAITLEIPRPHVIVDKQGLVKAVEEEKSDPAHNLIEEFMLIANESVAHFLIERGLPYIGRIHPPPPEDAKEDFWEFCDELKLAHPDFDEPGELQQFLDSVKNREGFDAIHYALLRSMTRAVYHAGPDLHYALAVREYVHFTSPIRRYPDTITHQVLTAYMKAGGVLRWQTRGLELPWADGATGTPGKALPGKKINDFHRWEFSLPHVAAHCTERSIRADRGEIAASQIKLLRTLQSRIGEEFKGTVVGVNAAQLTVRLDGVLAEGYLEFRELSEGWAEVHKFWAHYETRAGVRKIVLGDRMDVQISDIDLGSRSMRLVPVGKHARQRRWGETDRVKPHHTRERRGGKHNRRRR